MEVGKEVGRCQEVIRTNQWLSDLVNLVQGEGNVEARRVRAITLLVLRGVAAWLRQKANNAGLSNQQTLANLIQELEQWKV